MDNKLLGKVSKGLASTIIASLLVFSQTGVSEAAEVTKKVEVNPQIKILNNGLLVPGSDVAPIVINGTTYLPVRSLSTVLNKTVLWDGLTKSIFITDNVDPNESKNEIANLERYIKTRDAKISELELSIKTKDTKITELDNLVKTKDTKVAELENAGKTKDAKILELENAIKVKDARIAELEKNNNFNSNTTLKEIEKQLNRDHRFLKDMNAYIVLKEERRGINVQIEVNLRDNTDFNNWKNLKKEDLTNYVNGISRDIWYYDRNAEISGNVFDVYENKAIGAFYNDSRNSMSVSKY